ncbi:hypothetical protein B0A48_12705 [Cryoendolithus antarcticus]|uniref:Mediator of RNA polymerase II transcription subunit 11 n=1 Tax=Cryoendolithus antarcticus TaxID=1507870 RepID=A0A1V8SRL8_9PEZI|nr:hypothetical protein B0A48_12705 [Cryoendolithus antarcticus]
MALDPISPSDRIRELSVINADIASLVESAGLALTALTNKPLSPDQTNTENPDTLMIDSTSPPSLSSRQEAFTTHTEAYYTSLQSITARLRRQAYALEEAGILSPGGEEVIGLSVKHAPTGKGAGGEAEKLENGGLGRFDIGWLNGRGNKVGEVKERELVEEARELIEGVLKRKDEGEGEGKG